MSIDPVSYLKTSFQASDRACDLLYKQICNHASQFNFTLDRQQKWILRHEIASFVANYHHLIFRFMLPEHDDLISDAYAQYIRIALNYGKQTRRPWFSSLPKTFDFIKQRSFDYEDAFFAEYFISQHLLPFLSDAEAARITDFPLNQAQAFFCECVACVIVSKRHTPVDFQKEIVSLTLSDIYQSTVISAFAYLIHSVADTFITSTLPLYLPDADDREQLYVSPQFVNS